MKLKSIRKWIGVLVLIILFRIFVFEVYIVPSQSMMSTLLPGDVVLASKIHFGTRFNLGNDLKRAPYLSSPQMGDVIIFNFPEADTIYSLDQSVNYHSNHRRLGYKKALNYQSKYGPLKAMSVLERQTYVKRLVALPGDTIQMINDSLIVNNEWQKPLKDMNGQVNKGELAKNEGFKNFEIEQRKRKDSIVTAFNKLAHVKPNKAITQDKRITRGSKPEYQWMFPHEHQIPWDEHNFGPLIIPKKGTRVELDTSNICFYEQIIRNHEHHKLQIKNGVVYIDDELETSYTFEKDYYYTLGDFRDYSADSRYWGFLPEDHIKAKATMVLFNTNYYNSSFWFSRLLNWIN